VDPRRDRGGARSASPRRPVTKESAIRTDARIDRNSAARARRRLEAEYVSCQVICDLQHTYLAYSKSCVTCEMFSSLPSAFWARVCVFLVVWDGAVSVTYVVLL